MKKPTLKLPVEGKTSGINYDELWEFYPEFFDHISEILKSETVKPSMKEYVNEVLEFLEDWDSITWKQFKSILKIHESFVAYKNSLSGKVNKFSFGKNILYFDSRNSCFSDKKLFTERDIDMMTEMTFGERPYFEEEENGMVLSYRKDGSRCFLFPLDNN